MNRHLKEQYKEEIKDYILNNIDYYLGTESEDLHHNLFNTDYYIIGYYKAEQFCKNNVFQIIDTIKEYEQNNFGEVTTDLSSSESVVNMFVYILGEEILSDCNLWEITNGGGNLEEWQIKHIKENLNKRIYTA